MEECPREKHKKTKSGTRLVYVIAEATHASAKKYELMKSEVSLRTCQAHTGAYVSRIASESGLHPCHPGNPTNVQTAIF